MNIPCFPNPLLHLDLYTSIWQPMLDAKYIDWTSENCFSEHSAPSFNSLHHEILQDCLNYTKHWFFFYKPTGSMEITELNCVMWTHLNKLNEYFSTKTLFLFLKSILYIRFCTITMNFNEIVHEQIEILKISFPIYEGKIIEYCF